MKTENLTDTEAHLLKELERVTCSRCGGTGQYSYCSMYGSRCFKCGGAGKVMTARGAAANEYLIRLRSKPAKDVRPGELVRMEIDVNISTGCGRLAFCTVTESRAQTPAEEMRVLDQTTNQWRNVPGWRLTCTRADRPGETLALHTSPDNLVRVGQTAEQKAETLQRALAFQATLTKAGKPRKR
jgi:RecJ-like exonuclease